MSAYFVNYRVRCWEINRDGRRTPQEWNIHSTVVDRHPVAELLRWKKDLLYHTGSAPKSTDRVWLEHEWQLLWWAEIPDALYQAAHKYEQEEGGL